MSCGKSIVYVYLWKVYELFGAKTVDGKVVAIEHPVDSEVLVQVTVRVIRAAEELERVLVSYGLIGDEMVTFLDEGQALARLTMH